MGLEPPTRFRGPSQYAIIHAETVAQPSCGRRKGGSTEHSVYPAFPTRKAGKGVGGGEKGYQFGGRKGASGAVTLWAV